VSRIVKQSLSYYCVGRTAKEVDLVALIEDLFMSSATSSNAAALPSTRRSRPEPQSLVLRMRLASSSTTCWSTRSRPPPGGGRLTLCLRRSRNWKNRSEAGTRLSVADNGCGIPKADLARVFDPFFTTKAEKGTGLGLWVVRGIVEKQGGSIKIRSTDQAAKSGTVISIFWPYDVKQTRDENTPRKDR
jgi:hypothetical protein